MVSVDVLKPKQKLNELTHFNTFTTYAYKQVCDLCAQVLGANVSQLRLDVPLLVWMKDVCDFDITPGNKLGEQACILMHIRMHMVCLLRQRA